MPAPCGLVTLTTDFGLADSYVAQLHAVLLQDFPAVRIVDVSHAVEPGSCQAALFLTECAWPNGSAATQLRLAVGDELALQPAAPA